MRRSEKFFFIFIIIILIPSVVFAYKAYKSIGVNRDTLLLKERFDIDKILNKISEKTEEELLKREQIENKRPYYEYSYYFTPASVISRDDVIQKSPLSEVPQDKLIMGYFQIDDKANLTSPYFFQDTKDDGTVDELKYKKKFLSIVRSKAKKELAKEVKTAEIVIEPLISTSQNARIQWSYENIAQVYDNVNRAPDEQSRVADSSKANELDIVKYFPIDYLYNRGGVFAYRKVMVRGRRYIQGYMINLGHLTDDILKRFIEKNTPDNFAIYSSPLEGKRYYASASVSTKLTFIKLYVYKKNNSTVEAIIKEELLEYYISAFALFAIVIVGSFFIYSTIKGEAELTKKKDDFISAVTHELKTPLTSIRMYSEMLKEGMVTQESKKELYYEYMLKESERLTRLVNNVLDFSKLENNKKVFNMTDGSLKELFLELYEKYKSNLMLAGFKFTSELEDVGVSKFDKDTMTQVFINLIDNAIKYSAISDKKEIEVRLYKNGGKTVIEVVDKGVGIPKGEMKAIFDKFYRVESELTRRTKGSGIGLSIVKEYVKAHNGTVEAMSNEGEGTKFKITLS
ncbi:sensor histidine kinase [Thermodesulfobacteriota bacterium]